MSADQLDRGARGRLRGLAKDNADVVARHLIMAGRLLDTDPELAYEHAQAAVRRGGRIDVVREAAGLTAYHLGRYAEALRELRTVRRLNGSSEHLAVMADCERGLGRPERAIDLSGDPGASTLDRTGKAELALVVSGARLDLGQVEAAAAVLDGIDRRGLDPQTLRRLSEARIGVLEAAGDVEAAAALRARLGGDPAADDEVVVFDLTDGESDAETGSHSDSEPESDSDAGEAGADASVDLEPDPADDADTRPGTDARAAAQTDVDDATDEGVEEADGAPADVTAPAPADVRAAAPADITAAAPVDVVAAEVRDDVEADA